MNKLIASTAIALMALAPLTATAEPVRLLTDKASGNLNTGVGDDVIVVADEPVLAGSGLSTGAAIAVGVGGLLLLGALLSDDDDDDDSSSTPDS